MIRKFLPFVCIVLLLAACSKERRWSQEQREELRRELKEYRYYDYLSNMTDSEFDVFTIVVSDSLEKQYPDYAQLQNMPGASDTITMVVFTTIGYDLSADYKNMRYLYPYKNLVKEGTLPKGLSDEAVQSYYSCLADKVNANYPSMLQFLQDVMMGDTTQVNQFKQACAEQLGTIVATEIELTE